MGYVRIEVDDALEISEQNLAPIALLLGAAIDARTADQVQRADLGHIVLGQLGMRAKCREQAG